MILGLLREEKIPHERRTPFTPAQCKLVMDQFRGTAMAIQPCAYRCYPDDEYRAAGVEVREDLGDCDYLLGIKEVPPDKLIEGKSYLFFSHTIKKQTYNRPLLREILSRNVRLIDYECLVDEQDNRVIGFGRFAGLVGAYNAFMGYGRKYGLFELPHAESLHDKKEMFNALENVALPNVKIAVTGGGRVGNGACETFGAVEMRKVTPYEFLNYTFREPVYVQLHSEDYYVSRDGSPYSSHAFHNDPAAFRCTFSENRSFASVTDIIVHCAYWDPRADILFSRERMKDPDFRVSVIADITCDIDGSIPSTTRPSTISDKFYGYNPLTGEEDDPLSKQAIMVMAIDNLPCELPRDASEGFGKHLFERVLPHMLEHDNGLIERATIAREGQLMPRFAYLKDFVEES